ncbi:hypothetical protein H1C71_014694, partial [Ictidomys tridecemlineatus]
GDGCQTLGPASRGGAGGFLVFVPLRVDSPCGEGHSVRVLPSLPPPLSLCLLARRRFFFFVVASSRCYCQCHVPYKVGEWQTTSFCPSLPFLTVLSAYPPWNFLKEKWLAKQKQTHREGQACIAAGRIQMECIGSFSTAMKEPDTCTHRRDLK